MRSGLVVVFEAHCQNALQMRLVEHDDMVEAFSADRTYQPFYERILPGTPMGGEHLVDTHVLYAISKCRAVDKVPIPPEKPWC